MKSPLFGSKRSIQPSKKNPVERAKISKDTSTLTGSILPPDGTFAINHNQDKLMAGAIESYVAAIENIHMDFVCAKLGPDRCGKSLDREQILENKLFSTT
jgi:hypothetical protein